ncbi:MAG: hypothetical protein WCG23_13165 [bacterium]
MFNSVQQKFSTPNYKNIAFKGNAENKTGRGSSGSQPVSEDVYTGRRGSSPAPAPAASANNGIKILGSSNNNFITTKKPA